MDESQVVTLVKERLGFRTAVRDTYLAAIVRGVIKELTDEKGIALDPDDSNHLMFCVDYAAWRYDSRDEPGGIPRHLQFRLHNLQIRYGGVK